MQTLTQTSRSNAKLLLSTILIVFTLSPLHAQQRSLITHSVDEFDRVTLRGNVHSVAQDSLDLGRVPDSQPTGTMMLVLGRSSAQQAALDSYVMSASSPGTASYHQWLTPATYNSRFGASPQDIATVQAWLEAQGFSVQVAQAGNVIRFSGTMAAVSAAFQTEMHSYEVAGVRHIANVGEPSIPAALTPVIRGIASLNDFHPQSQLVRGGHSNLTSKGNGMKPALTISNGTPWGGVSAGTVWYNVEYQPAAGDGAIIYDTPNTAMNSAYTGTTWTGSGVTIGIAGDSNLSSAAIADVARYRSFFLNETLAQANADMQLPKVVVDGADPGINGDQLEALVDVEQAEAFAPRALITLYTAANTDLQPGLIMAIQRAVNDNTVSILNVSFGECEQDLGAGMDALISEVYEQAAAEGISITAASGDSGSAACDVATLGFGVAAGAGLAVNGLASTPWNVAVGGTDFYALYTANFSTFQQYVEGTDPANIATQVGNPPFYGSALGYIPEGVWNDSTDVFTSYADNVQYKWGNGPTNTIAGGGGLSNAALCSGTISSTSGGCSGAMRGYAKPAFQTSITPADSVRDIPDVSFFTGDIMSDNSVPYFNATWAVCSDNTVNGETGAYNDCVPETGTAGCNGTCAISVNEMVHSDTLFYTTLVGGTSTSAPAMAGVLALVIQHQGGQRLGQADYGIYNLAKSNPGVFHDITQGNNSVLCATGSLNCEGNGFSDGYNAGAGYDYATGIGSLDVAKFVNAWSSISFTTTTSVLTAGTSSTSLSSSAIAVAHGTPIYFKVAVSPANATGNIVLTTNSTQENSDSITTAPISNGMASFSTLDLPAGTYTVYARYGGDTTNAASQSQGIPVNITSEVGGLQFSLNVYNAQTGALTATSPSSAVYGSQIAMDITPFGDTEGLAKGNPAIGTVTLSQGSVQLAKLALNSEGTVSYTPSQSVLTPGTYVFTAAYSGDGSYNASSITQTITITKAVLSGTIGPVSGTVLNPPVTSLYVGVVMQGFSNGAAPSGSFTFAINGTVLGSWPGTPYKGDGAAAAPLIDVGMNINETLTVPLAVGQTATILATYSGDANYAPASYTTTVSVAEPANAGFTLTDNGSLTIATAGQSNTATVTVTPTNGFGGSVTLTCVATGALSSSAPTCSIPASVSITGTAAQTATVGISTVPASAAFLPMAAGGGALSTLLFLFVPKRRRRALSAISLALLVSLLLPATGCGTKTGATGGGGSTGTPAGTYTFTITGINGAITNSTTLTVVVR